MIHVVVTGRPLDATSRKLYEGVAVAPVAELARQLAHPDWKPETKLDYFIRSQKVEPDAVPRDGDIVAIVPHIGEPVSIGLAIIALASSTFQYVRAKRAADKAKKAQELRRERAYGFDTPSLTAYGEGFRIPIGYGEYRTGGVVIGNRIEQSSVTRMGSELGLQIALCEGPIEAIGDIARDTNFLTRTQLYRNGFPDPRYPFDSWLFPNGVRINGLNSDGKGVSVSTRLGTMHQSPMPDWSTAATGVEVGGAPMTTAGNSTSYTTTESDVTRVFAALRFTEGLWYDGSNGIGVRRVKLRVEHRVGTNAWQGREIEYQADPPMVNPFDYWVDFQVPPGGGPYELRITRLAIPGYGGSGSLEQNGGHGDRAHSTFEWTSVQIQYGTAFSYPGLALLAVRMPGSEQLNGQVNNVSVPIKARKVRGFVSTALQFTPELWGWVAPWSFPLSSNPAFVALDLLTNTRYGLGRLVRDRDVDLEAFRDWADLCDQPHPLDNAQALLRFDGQFDAGTDAIEALAAVFAAGRAVPILSGGRLSVRFSYRDSFSRGSGPTLNTVPARVPVGIITTSSCRSFSITYSDPATDPQVIEWQILDRAADYEMRSVALEDAARSSSTLQDRPSTRSPRKESQQMLGVVRRLQARYEIQLLHNRYRLSRRTATLRMPLEALPYEIGDLVLLQHDALTPEAATTQSFRTRTGGVTSSVVVSKRIEITGANPRTDFGVWLFDVNGVEKQLTADYLAPTTIAEGGTLNLWDPVGLAPASVDIQKGTQVMCGPFTSTRQTYEITSITTEQNLTRTVELEEWHPEMFDMPDGFDESEGLGDEDAPVVVETASTASVEVVASEITAEGMRSTASIQWAPATAPVSRLARVYARTSDGRFSLLGETSSDRLDSLILHPGSTYDLHICRQVMGQHGPVFPLPEMVDPITVSVPEFGSSAPPAPPRLSAVVDNQRVHLHWPAVDDALAYEIRRGETWYGAEVLGVTQGTTFDVLMPPAGTSRYLLRPRGRSGLYADTTRSVDVTWQPTTVLSTVTHLSANVAGGTAVDVSWAGSPGAATITGSAMRGTWTSPAVDMGKDIFAYWSAGARVWAVDGVVDFSSYDIGQPARFFANAGGRQATRLYPGHDFDAGIATVPVDGYADADLTRSYLGEWVRVQVQTRYHVAGAWGAWEKHVPGWRMARQMEARVQLDRYATDISPYAKNLVLTVGQ